MLQNAVSFTTDWGTEAGFGDMPEVAVDQLLPHFAVVEPDACETGETGEAESVCSEKFESGDALPPTAPSGAEAVVRPSAILRAVWPSALWAPGILKRNSLYLC